MKLMIVESPNKVKKIQTLLAEGWEVLASSGHIRDLPEAELGLEGPGFALRYVFTPRRPIPGQPGKHYPGGEDRVARLAKAAKQASAVFLATDPDREGEAIAWHLRETLKLSPDRYWRVSFSAITAEAIAEALAAPRKIDSHLVAAQESRRALDRLVGWKVSPILRDRLGASASAGRVQSPTVRLVVERERAIRDFRPTIHWGAELEFAGGWKAVWDTKPHLPPDGEYQLDRALAEEAAQCRRLVVIRYDEAIEKRSPPSPFSTSLLLQEASSRLKFAPEQTAKIAQKLFEKGHITYHRTDSVNFSEAAIREIRDFAAGQGWPLPDAPRRFKSKAGAQEAHEAIRPTHIDAAAAGDEADERQIYELIRRRSLASQLADAGDRVVTIRLQAEIGNPPYEFQCRHATAAEPGWRAIAQDQDPEDREDEDIDSPHPAPSLALGETLQALQGRILEKETKAPIRYTQASLIRQLESCGIGRPSTYPAILANVLRRGYVIEEKRRLKATPLGEALVAFLVEGNFSFIDIGFTRSLEEKLDLVADGKAAYLDIVSETARVLESEIDRKRQSPPLYPCPQCGSALIRRKGKAGYFWGCDGYKNGCKTTFPDQQGKPLFKPSVQSFPGG